MTQPTSVGAGTHLSEKGARGTGLTSAVLACVFGAFSLLFLLRFQADLLAATLNGAAGGLLRYDPQAGAIVITLALLAIAGLTLWLTRRGLGHIPALAFVPSAIVLTALTASVEGADGRLGYRPLAFVVAAVALAVFCVVALTCGRWLRAVAANWQRRGRVMALLGNLLAMAATLLLVCALTNSDRVLHTRLRVERCLAEGRSDEALAVLEHKAERDTTLTLLTIETLEKERLLGQRLFTFPLADVRGQLARKTAKGPDLALCCYLLDGDLDAFARELVNHYEVSDSLPRHYREALTLYVHLRTSPVCFYHNAAMDADFEDFQHFGAQLPDQRARQSALRASYGKTYWYYFFVSLQGR